MKEKNFSQHIKAINWLILFEEFNEKMQTHVKYCLQAPAIAASCDG